MHVPACLCECEYGAPESQNLGQLTDDASPPKRPHMNAWALIYVTDVKFISFAQSPGQLINAIQID